MSDSIDLEAEAVIRWEVATEAATPLDRQMLMRLANLERDEARAELADQHDVNRVMAGQLARLGGRGQDLTRIAKAAHRPGEPHTVTSARSLACLLANHGTTVPQRTTLGELTRMLKPTRGRLRLRDYQSVNDTLFRLRDLNLVLDNQVIQIFNIVPAADPSGKAVVSWSLNEQLDVDAIVSQLESMAYDVSRRGILAPFLMMVLDAQHDCAERSEP